jgi:hypothetical protein
LTQVGHPTLDKSPFQSGLQKESVSFCLDMKELKLLIVVNTVYMYYYSVLMYNIAAS